MSRGWDMPPVCVVTEGYAGPPRLAEIAIDSIVVPGDVEVDPEIVAEFARAKRLEDVRPLSLFRDITLVSAKWKERIWRHCMATGHCIPFIEEHPEHGLTWHSLMLGERIYKKNIASWFQEERRRLGTSGRECDFEGRVAAHLGRSRTSVTRQVVCSAGIADIVTEREIVEVKLNGRDNDFGAFGQVLAYRAAIDPSLGVVIAVRSCGKRFARNARSLGIDLIRLPEGN